MIVFVGGCVTEPGPAPTPTAKTKGAAAIGGAQGLPAELYASDEVDVLPKPVYQVAPFYPEALVRQGMEGVVVMRVVVLADGMVGPIRLESSSHEAFERSAIDATRQWRFEPAIKGGKPVACVLRIPLSFRLGR